MIIIPLPIVIPSLSIDIHPQSMVIDLLSVILDFLVHCQRSSTVCQLTLIFRKLSLTFCQWSLEKINLLFFYDWWNWSIASHPDQLVALESLFCEPFVNDNWRLVNVRWRLINDQNWSLAKSQWPSTKGKVLLVIDSLPMIANGLVRVIGTSSMSLTHCQCYSYVFKEL